MAGGTVVQVEVGKNLVKRRKANNLEAIEGLSDKERNILELNSEDGDDMEPDESMAARDVTLLEQVDTDMTDLKCGEDGDDGVRDGDDMNSEDFMAAHSRRMTAEENHQCKEEETESTRAAKEEMALEEEAESTRTAKEQMDLKEETESTRAAKEQMDLEEETESTIAEKMALEETEFDVYRCSSEFSSFRSFEDMTTVSPMYCTHWTSDRILLAPGIATYESSLQIYSFKIQMKGEDLKWPLYVYGMVAARDEVDRKRNLLFNQARYECQILTQDDPFLRLTGPSRAIIAFSPVDFEVQLKLKGITESQDRPLMNKRYCFFGVYTTSSISIKFENCKCAAELILDHYPRTVQATVLGVRIVEGRLFPFRYGGRVVCYSPPEEVFLMNMEGNVGDIVDLSKEILLLDSRDFDDGVEMPMDSDGYFYLSRRVVTVKWKEGMKVVIQAYSESLAKSQGKKRCLDPKDIAAKGHVKFSSKYCNISQGMCDLGDSKVEVTVAWSAIVTSDKSASLTLKR